MAGSTACDAYRRAVTLSLATPTASAEFLRRVLADGAEVGDEAGDRRGEDEADWAGAQAEAAALVRDSQPGREGGAERTGDHVGEPEGEDRVHAEAEVADRWDRDHGREEQARSEVAEAEGDGGGIARGRAESEGGEHRRPVEHLPSLRTDAVDRERSLAPVPGPEDHIEDDPVEDRRSDVRHTEADAQDVGDHRADDADHRHRQPVGPGDVAVLGELDVEGDGEGDAAENDGYLGTSEWTRKSEVDSPIAVVSALTTQK